MAMLVVFPRMLYLKLCERCNERSDFSALIILGPRDCIRTQVLEHALGLQLGGIAARGQRRLRL